MTSKTYEFDQFTLEHVHYGLMNTDQHGHKMFADAHVRLGPMWLRAHLTGRGELRITDTLHDDDLRLAIGVALRKIVSDKICEDWKLVDEHERKRIADKQDDLRRQAGRCPDTPASAD